LPETELFIEAAEAAIKGDRRVFPGVIDMLWHANRAQGHPDRSQPLVNAYVARNYKLANDAINAGKWAESYKWAEVTADLKRGWERLRMGYCIVKSLWKMKRYRESLSQCERFISEFPNAPQFHFLFALIALETNERLEEAYEHAKIAVPLDPKNKGYKEALEKLGRKLGKPTTVK
jgi:tetratricopeptide (TPR) repeat protein